MKRRDWMPAAEWETRSEPPQLPWSDVLVFLGCLAVVYMLIVLGSPVPFVRDL